MARPFEAAGCRDYKPRMQVGKSLLRPNLDKKYTLNSKIGKDLITRRLHAS